MVRNTIKISKNTSFQNVSHGFSLMKSPKQPQSVTFILVSEKLAANERWVNFTEIKINTKAKTPKPKPAFLPKALSAIPATAKPNTAKKNNPQKVSVGE